MTCERCGHEHPSEVGRTLEDALLRCIANLRADLAEARADRAAMREAAAQAAETQPFYPDTHTGMRQQWVKVQIAVKIRALPPDAGRDLLTAVRRLMEAAHMVLHEDIHEERSYGALDAALADPALAGLRGSP